MNSPLNVSKPSILAIPFPGRGHINPMINFCRQLASKQPDLLITFVVTEEWFELLRSETKLPANISYETIPNVIPSELVRASDHSGFFKAVQTKMEEPVEWLIHRLDSRPVVIIFDFFMFWVPRLGIKVNIPVASLVPVSAQVFSMFMHYHLLEQKGDIPVSNVSDLPSPLYVGQEILPEFLEGTSWAKKTRYLLFTAVYELEQKAIDALRAEFSMPVYAIGPAIPDFSLKQNCLTNKDDVPHYIEWLDNQPIDSVLYISQGSFLSVSSDQLDEIVAGVLDSGVSYLWVTKMEASRVTGEKGLAVPWCDQLRVLCHPSVGGFWSHCGWNSTKESVFAGVPMLTMPIKFDQVPNSNVIVDDWKIGWRVKRPTAVETLVTRNEIAALVNRFMDLKNDEGKMMRKRVKELEAIARQATAQGGSSENDIDAFIHNILQCNRD
ncbi:UDP-glycosyltransferase 87A1-like [Apium graveolens]|uniref:UDP-glycosyltransferase 87A1-like n=1 Tax=Apium graveolens TaxID=4045 RepID=UPI003D79A430